MIRSNLAGFLMLGVCLTLFVQCQTPRPRRAVRVAMAANLSPLAKPLQKAFQKHHPSIEIEWIEGSSGKLTQQMMQGAAWDVFLSADTLYPWQLYQASLTQQKPAIYTYGKLIFWTRESIDTTRLVDFLLSDRVRKIALANPETAPYGKAAWAYLKQQKLDSLLGSKWVIGESISQVNQYLVSGVVEGGFTAQSLQYVTEAKGIGIILKIPAIPQGAVKLRYCSEEGAMLYAFLFTDEAKQIFAGYGYVSQQTDEP
ncbi:MAG TPA: molybdate ABC transporter substrate-binding protein [Microscillaceae bacterium]|nr:molybdate ABC transporter substrate-binding protein [Microscillaceae bacterium]